MINGDVPIKNLASCAGMTDTKLWGPRCFITLAVQLHDISVCDHIADASSQATCRAKLS